MAAHLEISKLEQQNISDDNIFTIAVNSLCIKAGEIVGLKGPSGVGKTTLLETIALMRPTTALESYRLKCSHQTHCFTQDSWFNEANSIEHVRGSSVAYVNQQLSLLPYFTLLANVTFHSRLLDRFDQQQTEQILEQLGLAGLQSRLPSELSTGQKQRAIIARAILAKPDLLLLDEPTSALNAEMAATVQELVRSYIHENSAACVLVSHNPELLEDTVDKLCCIRIESESDTQVRSSLAADV